MKKQTRNIRTAFLLLICIIIVCLGFFLHNQLTALPKSKIATSLANPASVHCEEAGGKLEIRKLSDGSEYGVCAFDGGYICEEWQLFRGECDKPIINNITTMEFHFNPTLLTCPHFPQRYGSTLYPENMPINAVWQTLVPSGNSKILRQENKVQIGIRNKLGLINDVFPLTVSVTTPRGTLGFTKTFVKGSQWAYVTFPHDFTNGSLIENGTYTVVYQLADSLIACSGFVLK